MPDELKVLIAGLRTDVQSLARTRRFHVGERIVLWAVVATVIYSVVQNRDAIDAAKRSTADLACFVVGYLENHGTAPSDPFVTALSEKYGCLTAPPAASPTGPAAPARHRGSSRPHRSSSSPQAPQPTPDAVPTFAAPPPPSSTRTVIRTSPARTSTVTRPPHTRTVTRTRVPPSSTRPGGILPSLVCGLHLICLGG